MASTNAVDDAFVVVKHLWRNLTIILIHSLTKVKQQKTELYA